MDTQCDYTRDFTLVVFNLNSFIATKPSQCPNISKNSHCTQPDFVHYNEVICTFDGCTGEGTKLTDALSPGSMRL
jgi:hypothetical protein